MGKISKNILVSELSCPCGCGFCNIQIETIDMFQSIADYTNSRIHFNRVCCCIEHHISIYIKLNIPVNWNSVHLIGGAGDLKSIDRKHDYFCLKLKELYDQGKIGGLILYDTFSHVDIRRLKYFEDRRTK